MILSISERIRINNSIFLIMTTIIHKKIILISLSSTLVKIKNHIPQILIFNNPCLYQNIVVSRISTNIKKLEHWIYILYEIKQN